MRTLDIQHCEQNLDIYNNGTLEHSKCVSSMVERTAGNLDFQNQGKVLLSDEELSFEHTPTCMEEWCGHTFVRT